MTDEVRVCGLDVSATATGVAVVTCTSGRVECTYSRVLRYPAMTGLERAEAISQAVGRTLTRHWVQVVGLEGYAYANKNTLVTLVEVGTTVRLGLRAAGMPVCLVSPSQVKKFAAGRGNAPKEVVLASVYQRWGHMFATTHEAEAFVCAAVAAAAIVRCEGLTRPMREVVDAVGPPRKLL